MNEASAQRIIALLERQCQLLERIIEKLEFKKPAGWSAGSKVERAAQ